MPGIGIGIGIPFHKGIKYDADLVTYLDSLTTSLSAGQRSKLNTLVKDIKSGLGITSLSDAFDVLYILANETEEAALHNLAKRAHDATAVNSPIFTALEGIKGDAASAYIDMDYNPYVDGVCLTTNDAMIGGYYRVNNMTGVNYCMGSNDATYTNLLRLTIWEASAYYYCLINTNTSGQSAIGQSVFTGLLAAQRVGAGSTDIEQYMNGNSVALSDTFPVSDRTNHNMYGLALNNNGVATAYSNTQFSLMCLGKSLTSTQHTKLFNAFEKYMDSNGKGVVS